MELFCIVSFWASPVIKRTDRFSGLFLKAARFSAKFANAASAAATRGFAGLVDIFFPDESRLSFALG